MSYSACIFWLFLNLLSLYSLESRGLSFKAWYLDGWYCDFANARDLIWCKRWKTLNILFITWLKLIEDTISYMIPQVSALHQVKHQIEGISVLKREMHVNNKGRIDLRKKNSFVHDTLNAFLGHHSEYSVKYTLISAFLSSHIGFLSFYARLSKPFRSLPFQ